MKVWKLVSGILSIILFVFVSFQSCAAGVSNALEANGEASGSAGIIVANPIIAANPNSTMSAIFPPLPKDFLVAIETIPPASIRIATIIGFAGYGSFSDLAIWAGWCLINAVLAVVALVMAKKNN